jgi:CDGSH-type Zn-finger protein
MIDNTQPKIVVLPNGPYLVSGAVPLSVETIGTNAQGESWTWESGRSFDQTEKYALCRCGQSASKPYCDGTHARVEWDGRETASHAPFAEQAKTIEGPIMDLLDADVLCAFARFCDNAGTIWKLVTEATGGEPERITVHEGESCPSGRLVLRRRADGSAIEPQLAAAIAITEDPAENSAGPIWVRGGITVIGQDGTPYEARNRQTLCRCGKSSNKPFCDGTHVDVDFHDDLG